MQGTAPLPGCELGTVLIQETPLILLLQIQALQRVSPYSHGPEVTRIHGDV
jgi:hypothetical protein